MSCQRGFTLLELAVVVVTVLVLLGLIIPATNRSICIGRRGENMSRVRGIHQNLVLWSADNNGFYPGLNAKGQPVDLTVEARFQTLLDEGYLVPTDIISPGETLAEWQPGTPLTAANFSYAMLHCIPKTNVSVSALTNGGTRPIPAPRF